ncbi:MAG: type II toxin-antitoxin system RelE/ParE family toxin [Thermonemataceae bacterium]|nr:type II toxin-antitoxin system RelE/ParE family toxin [Thermonemataceae bacterium]
MSKAKVIPTNYFNKKAKPLIKKFKSLQAEINVLAAKIEENPTMGIDLGNNIRKIRLASKSKGKGKSGGFRIITYLLDVKKNDIEVYLLSIYDKSEIENMLKEEIQNIVKEIKKIK